eukprot:13452479-Ditylum_brightwellii.AAC.1
MSFPSSYSCLFLYKVFLHEENQHLFYLMEGLNSNNELWNCNTQLWNDGTISIAFVKDSTTLIIHSTNPEETKCSGLFCDEQHDHKIAHQKSGCGCYTTLSQRSIIAFDHWMIIKKDLLHITMENFSSSNFSSYYLSECLPGSICLSVLQMTPALFDMINSIENVVEYVNANGGWTVIG